MPTLWQQTPGSLSPGDEQAGRPRICPGVTQATAHTTSQRPCVTGRPWGSGLGAEGFGGEAGQEKERVDGAGHQLAQIFTRTHPARGLENERKCERFSLGNIYRTFHTGPGDGQTSFHWSYLRGPGGLNPRLVRGLPLQQMEGVPAVQAESRTAYLRALTGKGGIYKRAVQPLAASQLTSSAEGRGFFRLPCSVELKKSISCTEK